MICVECGGTVGALYTYYSDNTILATTCPKCGQFADKYIEAEYVVVVLDLLLLRPAAMRHIIFNVEHQKIYHTIALVTLFDVYLQWAQTEKLADPVTRVFIDNTSMWFQYTAFLTMCSAETIALHASVRFLANKLLGWQQPDVLSTAILLGSTSKLLPILTLIWNYDMPLVALMVRYAVGLCMVEVLKTTLGCSYVYAAALSLTALLSSWLVHETLWKTLLFLVCENYGQ